MRKIVIPLVLIGLVGAFSLSYLVPKVTRPTRLMALKEKYSQKPIPKTDHSKYIELQRKFATPQEVTEACIRCHPTQAQEVLASNHWRWEEPEYIQGRGVVYLGKTNAINNFCIGVEGNEVECAKCHIGYGMTSSQTFDYNDARNIDCLVCHDQTETYAKAQERAGMPVATLDLTNIAQHVGRPRRSDCGVCHFFGGGGNNVKHGDLEKALFEPTRDVDVHMAVNGANLDCVDCHVTKNHNISGQLYSMASMDRNRSTCEECHGEEPHSETILNKHTLKVSCEACHIPVYAKANETKLAWDWSQAGKLKDGEPYEVDDSEGNPTYLSIKGSFKWGKDLKPDYVWFDGTAQHYLLGDTISDTTRPVVLNPLNGSYADNRAKIIPVKIHLALQPFDPVERTLIQPKLFAENKGEGAFWKDFDWERASEGGMKTAGLPFSGKVSFIRTEMYWPVNHMVSGKENTVKCEECHSRNHSRLAALRDFYMPARDHSPVIESSGAGLVLATLLAILVHGLLRILASAKLPKSSNEEHHGH